jgi:hypothetical protein
MNTGLTKVQMAAIYRLDLEQNANRADAITWACDIEQALQGLLRTAMIDDPEVSNLFDDSDGPLSSFAAQVKLAWATGLIDSELRRDLDYVRKIRNRFAHESEQKSFSTSPVREWFQQLSPVENGRLIVKDFSRSEYHKVIFEIQLTLMALMWQKLNSEDNVEQIRATLREMIDHTVDAVIPPRSGNEDSMDSVIAKCNASLADKPMLASIYDPDWRRDKAKELHEPGTRCYLPSGYLLPSGQWRLEEGASVLLPKLNTCDRGHIVKRMQGVGSTSAEEELLLARGFALEFGRGAINVPQTPSDEIRPEFEVDTAGARILVEAKGRVDTQFAARRRYAEDILNTTFPPSADLDDDIDRWLKRTIKDSFHPQRNGVFFHEGMSDEEHRSAISVMFGHTQ